MRKILSISPRVAAIGVLVTVFAAIALGFSLLTIDLFDRPLRADMPDQTYYEADANFERYCSRTVYFDNMHNRESPLICDLHQRLQAIETESRISTGPK